MGAPVHAILRALCACAQLRHVSTGAACTHPHARTALAACAAMHQQCARGNEDAKNMHGSTAKHSRVHTRWRRSLRFDGSSTSRRASPLPHHACPDEYAARASPHVRYALTILKYYCGFHAPPLLPPPPPTTTAATAAHHHHHHHDHYHYPPLPTTASTMHMPCFTDVPSTMTPLGASEFVSAARSLEVPPGTAARRDHGRPHLHHHHFRGIGRLHAQRVAREN